MRLKAFKAALRKAVVPASNRWSRSAAAAAQGWKENDGKYSLRANRAPAEALAEAAFAGKSCLFAYKIYQSETSTFLESSIQCSAVFSDAKLWTCMQIL